MKYKKKPVIIEAHRFNGSSTSKRQLENWIETGEFKHRGVHTMDYVEFQIETLEGMMAVIAGDYVIKGIKGEFYPCKPDIFEMTYEQIEV